MTTNADIARTAMNDPAVQEQLHAAADRGRQAYCTTFTTYMGLLGSYTYFDSRFLNCNQEDWHSAFEFWNVTWMRCQILCCIVYTVLAFVVLLASLQLLSIIMLAVVSVVSLIVALIFAHLSWWCVVVNNGCCGNVGYFIWALIFLIDAIWLLGSGKGLLGLVYLILTISTAYLMVICWKLGAGSTARQIVTAVSTTRQSNAQQHSDGLTSA
mmetsp:Transcript_96633/g.201979  ORF Transcript_96633/g.201979 Transcript_96633/m.201979 type:complete len:212 (-) Transcript_96633:287-922(-)